jgi:hypothetical protein
VCFEVRREVSIYRGGNLGVWSTSSPSRGRFLFSGAQLASPCNCSMQENVLEVVEVKTGEEPEPKGSNRA